MLGVACDHSWPIREFSVQRLDFPKYHVTPAPVITDTLTRIGGRRLSGDTTTDGILAGSDIGLFSSILSCVGEPDPGGKEGIETVGYVANCITLRAQCKNYLRLKSLRICGIMSLLEEQWLTDLQP